MKLELGLFEIKNVIAASSTRIQDQILYVNLKELTEAIVDDRFSKMEIDIVHPGDNVRIINVLDVIEPRIKVEGGESFPGWVGKMGVAGTGKTHALKGVGVIETGIKRLFSGAILDMSGPGSEVANFSELHHVILITEPASGISEAEYSRALKMAGLKTAQYLAGASVSLQPDQWRIYESGRPTEPSDTMGLPRIAYVYISECHELLKEIFVYGDNLPYLYFPMVFHPNEFMDGAILGGSYKYNPGLRIFTYSLQNNPVIEALYGRHGRDLIFTGVVMANANLALTDKKRSAIMVGKLVKFNLGADGVIITKEGGGHPDIDLMECCEQCEILGVKSCLINSEMLAPDGVGSAMVAFSKFADCVISVGNIDETVELPPVQRVIGGETMGVDNFEGPFDGPMKVPIRMFPNAISLAGLTKVTTEEF
jgi:glycine reductase